MIQTAALLAHGIAQAQAFVDGNRRTAYFATLSFLHANGYGHLSPKAGEVRELVLPTAPAEQAVNPGDGIAP